MRLKRLNLQGFKTFAPKTDLVFGEGLTAIVGPNGSGKSNVADAVRWVLGEQSLSNLRAKRTEDLVFAGSSRRAPLGMAEVSITLDNTDRIVPLDFAEVTLTRRAYRSGENEYYINKSKARLRDILEVAQALGQAYTVVGQGLVDAALSLKPEERRELFEEAATIRGYFVQREDALRRLNRTEENIARVNDLAVELEPQVRRMERQAKQAQDYLKLEAELHALLKTWYAGRWRVGLAGLRKAQASEMAAGQALEARKAALADISACVAEARSAVWARIEAVSSLQEQRAQLAARHAAQSQQQAIIKERISAAAQRRESLSRELGLLQAQMGSTQTRMAEFQADEQRQMAEIASLEEAGREVAAKIAILDEQISVLQSDRGKTTSKLETLLNRQSVLKSRLDDAERQSREQDMAARTAEAEIAEQKEKLASAEAELVAREAQLAEAQSALSRAESDLSAAREALPSARASQSAAEAHRRDLMRSADSLLSQIAALTSEQQAGLYAGVRAVAAAASDGKLPGYVGTVAELLRVPSHLEVAVEAALGGRLQEVVMSSWEDAERAIAMLKQKGAGRATFLPLNTLRASPGSAPPKGPGIVGLALDLVEYDPSLRTLAEMMLGRLLIVEDLPSARKTLATFSHNSPWTLATLGGEVVRPGGSVTGGSNARDDDNRAKGRTILARERKRRELQVAHQGAQLELKAAERSLEQALALAQRTESELSVASNHSEEARKQYIAAQMRHVEQHGLVSRLQQELEWRDNLLSDAHKSIQTLTSLASQLSVELNAAEGELLPLRQKLEEQELVIRRIVEQRAEVIQSSGASATRRAVLSETLRNVRGRQADLRKEAAQVEHRSFDLKARIQKASEEEEALSQEIERQSQEVEQLAHQLQQTEAQIGPSEGEVKRLESEVTRIEGEQATLQSALLDAETAYSHATIEKERCISLLESLQREVAEEFGSASVLAPQPVAAEVGGRGAAVVAWESWATAWQDGNSTLEVTATLDAHHGNGQNGHNGEDKDYTDTAPSQAETVELERRVYALKARLSRLGPVNALAVEEHAALSERHDFLQKQLHDLLAAAESLRRVIGELDRTMRDQLAATFVQVNEAFQNFFHTLFGGGTARLELTNPQDVTSSGVEISAQPPGKRMQPLAALSGGERALTSVALLFALLRVRPVPFCVLDEVDAALDESNVTRFRSALQELGKQTQFVIITHNRGTIEAADTLYGVSMAGDGTSQLLSLKV
jgi:chromosome segregation protein